MRRTYRLGGWGRSEVLSRSNLVSWCYS